MAQSWNFIGGLAGYPSFATAAFFGLRRLYVGDPAKSRARRWYCRLGLRWPRRHGVRGLSRRRDPASARALFRDRQPDRRRDAARDRQRHARFHRRRQRPQSADLADFGDGGGAVLLLRHAACSRCICTAAAIVIHPSKLGFGLRCIQQNEDAANILGVNTYALQDRGVFVVRRVRRRGRRDLRLMGEVHRSTRRVRRAARRQANGHGAARRARHDLRARRSAPSSCWLSKNWCGGTSSPSTRRRSASSSWC